MSTAAASSVVSNNLQDVMMDLRALQRLLLSDDIDARVLTDFRSALNRVRNMAWAAQRSVALQVSGESPSTVASVLAGERVRAAYQLCQVIQEDLGNQEIDLQKGQLTELQGVVTELMLKLARRLGD